MSIVWSCERETRYQRAASTPILSISSRKNTTSPRRFDTRFFIAVVPRGQEAVHCGRETTAGAWLAPTVALEQFAAGTIKLMQPTEAVLRALAPFATTDEALAWARAKPIRTVNPTRVADQWALNVEGGRW